MIKCQNCGFMNDEGSAFCEECGTKLERQIYCEKCGKLLRPGSKFCSACGSRVPSDNIITSLSEIKLGDKNVISGDVKIVGSQDVFHVYNSSLVNGTQKVEECQICGKHIPIINSFTCKSCGKIICEGCFDSNYKLCIACATEHKKKIEREKQKEESRRNEEIILKASSYIAKADAFFYKEGAEKDRVFEHIRNKNLVIGDSFMQKKAFVLYAESALNNPDAMNMLGIAYLFGYGCDKDEKRGLMWLSMAVQYSDNGEFEYNLGCAYHNGLGTVRDLSRAYDLYEKAAEKGIPDSMVAIGEIYRETGNYSKAMEWYRKAVELGYTEAEEKMKRIEELYKRKVIKQLESVLICIANEKRKDK